MSDTPLWDHSDTGTTVVVDPATAELARCVANNIGLFLQGLETVARSADLGRAVPLLLVEVSDVLLAGARLGVHHDFAPLDQYEPDLGMEIDVEPLRLQLAQLLAPIDAYTEIFDPYAVPPEPVDSLLSDDLTAMATELEQGLRHYRAGQVSEALWWWQYSYLASWGPQGSGVLRALHAVAMHDRLDAERPGDEVFVAATESWEERLLAP